MIYFDNAATSFPKAPGVGEAMSRFVNEGAANPGRAGHRLAVAAGRMVDDVRLRLTRLVDGDDPDRMILALNCTDALNMGIKGVLAGSLAGGDRPHVVTTVLEHNSVSRPLQAMAAAGEIELTRLDCDDAGRVAPDSLEAALTPRTQLVVVTHASNVIGTIQDVGAMGNIAREHGALFCVDAAQTMGLVPISVREMAIDLLAFPGHKALWGPTGIAGLYVGDRCPAPDAVSDMDPATATLARTGHLRSWREGGTGGDSATPTQPAEYPHYLEGGTPNTVGIAGLQAALHEGAAAVDGALDHERALIQRILDRFSGDERFTFYGPGTAEGCVGTLAFNVAGYQPEDVGSILDDSFEIAVRPGLHCAPYIHRRLGTFPEGAIRVSPGRFNTEAEADTLIDALDQIA